MEAGSMGGNPSPIGGLRGKIKGWSSASRRRMRLFLITHRPKDDHVCFNSTLTIPGPVMSAEEWRVNGQRIFHAWHCFVLRQGWSCVWRLELQKRGQPHFHCLIGAPPETKVCAWWPETKCNQLWPSWQAIEGGWLQSLDVLGTKLSRWKGAREFAVKTESRSEVEHVWFRYMNDHVTKYKQEQVAEGFGRHWGVIGRKHLQDREPFFGQDLKPKEYACVCRWVGRWQRKRLKCPTDPRGYRYGKKSSRGRWGKSVWFGNPDVCLRMVLHALDLSNP